MSSRKFIRLCKEAAYRADAYGEREKARSSLRAFAIIAAAMGYALLD